MHPHSRQNCVKSRKRNRDDIYKHTRGCTTRWARAYAKIARHGARQEAKQQIREIV